MPPPMASDPRPVPSRLSTPVVSPDAPLKHVIAQYRHREAYVECVCGWTGSSASTDGHTSDWSRHVAANQRNPRR